MQTQDRQAVIKDKSIHISCVVPVYNEQEVISSFIQELAAAMRELSNHFEIIVVDDGSRDQSIEKIQALPKDCRVKLLGLSRNFGKEAALTAGIEHAQGDVVILLDADFQHPVEVLQSFLQKWAEGYDMVYGERQDREIESVLKRNFARLFYWVMQKITNINIPNNAGDFRLMDKKIVEAIKKFPERTRFMKGLYAWVGYKTIGVPYEVRERAGGKSSWGFTRLTELGILVNLHQISVLR